MEVIRRRARHRLIGATVLVLAGVIGFPLLFDSQPRPVAVDVPITIPDRNQSKPLAMPPAPVPAVKPAPAPAPVPVSEPASRSPQSHPEAAVAAVSKPSPAAAPLPEVKKPVAAPQVAAAPVRRPQAHPAEKVDRPSKPEITEKSSPVAVAAKPASRTDDGSRARALLEGREPVAAPAESGRIVIQVGAYADAGKAKEVRQKLEKAGLKTYTQVVDAQGSKRIRVRLGPYGSKAEADKAASRVRKLDLPASVLSL